MTDREKALKLVKKTEERNWWAKSSSGEVAAIAEQLAEYFEALHDQTRWRRVEEELPEKAGYYEVGLYDITDEHPENHVRDDFIFFDGSEKWSTNTHPDFVVYIWRKAQPLPDPPEPTDAD
jgi:hypothetical protein